MVGGGIREKLREKSESTYFGALLAGKSEKFRKCVAVRDPEEGTSTFCLVRYVLPRA